MGLDLRGVVKHWEGEEQEPVYDCYAVSNHFGGLGGGHYTAYAKGDDGEWCNFDDSRVTTGVEESEVVSSAAYCLYYMRKDVSSFNDDIILTKEQDDDVGGIPVSPSPCAEDRGQSSLFQHDKDDKMDVDNNSAGSAASYRTPVASLNDETEDGMDDGDSAFAPPASEKERDVFF